ncbi:LuxR C-terminal-related transcriptional regulator [Xenorhabdus griffiniae]|uniref:LuxR C-terminal-related transcriptional regulator n=1 Tax=Xenorhabdus griffiniae TaxID=351672 RepID=A0ABY9XDD3_9GAMM|nr:LuxR C-terminal-related transcriptional regulator [Xenorhabdus griffiniae]MBD1227760.1 response regulator transcription factor [Xenorhabdus griffiniae]MBE8588605.1 response regulator transcription factor [Xenorhabdus griffiniae]WMV70919.1 LuxR C-terminal-related transcriptional regulator [Xenorhabdus griffiniae]WNH00595.1 LuxR C-terminal-related transcriptional regulator [Xenorhabdus griffiniae]
MKLLIIDECYYTRQGTIESLKENTDILSLGATSIRDAINILPVFSPDIILANLTSYGYYSEYCEQLALLVSSVYGARNYIYVDKTYPIKETPIQLTNKDFILKKKDLTILLKRLKEMASYDIQCYFSNFSAPGSIFSHQENRIIYYWMLEMDTHKIAKTLKISNSTVYSHKRHIIEKIGVSNKIELFFIYNIFKYFC